MSSRPSYLPMLERLKRIKFGWEAEAIADHSWSGQELVLIRVQELGVSPFDSSFLALHSR